ncbi:hypothetical protein [Streptomyces sp. ODS28]|uniref:hypothetical protein n=1 Tax=Streptomyces sp. ODS28 TaxID=3136688 RepID=UPI0031F17C51
MSNRHSRRVRRGLTAAAITAALALGAAGCGGDEGGGDAKKPAKQGQGDRASADRGSEQQPLAEVKGGKEITLTINSAKREAGGFVTVSGTVHNGGGSIWSAPGWQGDETELMDKNVGSVAGARLVDNEGRKRYYVLRDTDSRCLCTSFPQGIQAGETNSWYAQFPAPPQGNNKVDFQIADMPPASLTLSGGE